MIQPHGFCNFSNLSIHLTFIFHDFPTVGGCEILHQLIGSKHPIIGFLPSQIGGAGFRWPIHSIIHLPHYLFTIIYSPLLTIISHY